MCVVKDVSRLSDQALEERYREAAIADAAEAFLVIYARHRDLVRGRLEAAGLTPEEAKARLGSVFVRVLVEEEPDRAVPLRERLRAAARSVAVDPHWTPP